MRERLKHEDSSEEIRSCSKREIVYATWKKNELVRGNNVSVKEPRQGKWKGEGKRINASCPKMRKILFHELALLPILRGCHSVLCKT